NFGVTLECGDLSPLSFLPRSGFVFYLQCPLLLPYCADLCQVFSQCIMSRKRYRGHYCWSCGRVRANEKFSGRGHARHLCKDCARLGKEELAYRQEIRNLERLLGYQGHVP